MRELREIPALRTALEDARDYTLQLYAHLSPAKRAFPYLRTVNPPAWEVAHVGWFQEYWCLRFRDGAAPLPSRFADADPLLNSALIAHAERWQRPQLTWDAALDYLAREFADTLAALETSSPEQRYFFQLALFHEDMHGEALLMSLQTLGLPEPARRRRPTLPLPKPAEGYAPREIEFRGGAFEIGTTASPDFAFDNEMPAQQVVVGPFVLASQQVTNAQFLQFVEAGGYAREGSGAWRPTPRRRVTGETTAGRGSCVVSIAGSRSPPTTR
jgi:iron(II)-dependent oxidoreductase